MSTTKTINSKLDPLEWENAPKIVLYGTVLRTTGNQFGATITIKNASGTTLKVFDIGPSSGFESKFIGDITTIQRSDFPLEISSEITCSTDFDYSNAPQTSLGLKRIGGKDIPVCYQSTLFCNDNLNNPDKDMDYNDFVLTWQLYNSSTD